LRRVCSPPHPGPTPQRRRQLARLVLRRRRGHQQRGDLFLQAASLLDPDLFRERHMLLELLQALGHGLQLRLQPRLGQLLAVVDRLLVLLEDRLGDAGRRLGELGGDQLGLLLHHADPHLGGGRPHPLLHRPGDGPGGGDGKGQRGKQVPVHVAFLAG